MGATKKFGSIPEKEKKKKKTEMKEQEQGEEERQRSRTHSLTQAWALRAAVAVERGPETGDRLPGRAHRRRTSEAAASASGAAAARAAAAAEVNCNLTSSCLRSPSEVGV